MTKKLPEISPSKKLFDSKELVKKFKPSMIELLSIPIFKQPSESFKNYKEGGKASSEVLNSTSYETSFKKIDQLKSKIKKNNGPSLFKNIGEPF